MMSIFKKPKLNNFNSPIEQNLPTDFTRYTDKFKYKLPRSYPATFMGEDTDRFHYERLLPVRNLLRI